MRQRSWCLTSALALATHATSLRGGGGVLGEVGIGGAGGGAHLRSPRCGGGREESASTRQVNWHQVSMARAFTEALGGGGFVRNEVISFLV